MEIPLAKHLKQHAELIQFFESFPYDTGNDREIVIVGCAYIESVIKNSLAEYFVEDHSEIKALVGDSNGALAGLVQRSRLLYLVELIPKVIYADLKIIARIRNHFAHNVGASFSDRKIIDLCANLRWHSEAMMRNPPSDATARDIYQVGINQLVCYLNALPGMARHRRNARGN